ncbi:MAG: NlpC/P60 family protein [Verrucomicrobiales bacterium]
MISPRSYAIILLVPFLLVSCGPPARLKREAVAIAGRATAPSGGVKRKEVQQVCWELSRQGLRYSFGSVRPETGGLDCSGTVHYVLSRVGYRSVPRQSNHQYYWVKEYGNMNHESSLTESVLRRLKPGDLLFWSGTYRTGKRWPNISHVMFYSGRDPKSGTHYMFGGRSGGRRGLNGSEIDFFVLRPGESEGRSGKFVGYGRPPGLR